MAVSYLNRIEQQRKLGKVIGFTASTFELLHPGHIEMLSQAKRHCDFLIVGLLTDPTIDRPDTKNEPVETTFERWMRVQAITDVDMVIPFDTERDLVNMLHVLKPDFRFVGEEYKDKEHTGKHIKDIVIVYNERKHDWSSTGLKKTIKDHEIR